MTQESLDLFEALDAMLDPEQMKKKAAERNRPMDRSALVDFTATITGISKETVQKPSWSEEHLRFDIADVEPTRTTSRYTGSEEAFTIRMPDAGRSPGPDDEITLMINSIRALTPLAGSAKLIGMRITFSEDTEEYTYRSQKSGSWQDYKGDRFYYKAVKVVGATNGAAAKASPAITPETEELALSIIRETGEAGMPEKEFALAASKVTLLRPLWASIGDGKWVAAQLKAGKLSQTTEGSLAVVTAE